MCHSCVLSPQELELLDAKDIQTNVYIKHPVSLEQYLMEGSYNKVGQLPSPARERFVSYFKSRVFYLLQVFLARGNVPAESYNFFMDILLNTIR